jgi:hypothetical protein
MTIDEIFGKSDCKRILHVDVEIRKRETKPLSSRPSLEAKLYNERKPTESRRRVDVESVRQTMGGPHKKT